MTMSNFATIISINAARKKKNRNDQLTDIAFVESHLDACAMQELCFRHGIRRIVISLPDKGWHRSFATLASGRVAGIAFDPSDIVLERIVADLYRAGAERVVRMKPRHGYQSWWALLAGNSLLPCEPLPEDA